MNFKEPSTKFYEADIIKMQRVIKEIDENPGQTMKSYKIMYQKRMEQRKEQIEGLRQGRPVIDMNPLAPTFFRALGFLDVDRGPAQHDQGSGLSATEELLPKELRSISLKEQGRALGLPVDTACGCAWKYAVGIAVGSLPLEGVVLCEQYHCSSRTLYKLYVKHRWPNQPFYVFDVPPFETETCLEYVVKQFREFIEVAEKAYPGVLKYDEDKLIQLLAREEEALRLHQEIWQMQKHKPSPLAGQEMFDSSQWYGRDLEYLRAKRDETAERLAKGIVGNRPWEEKLRVCWSGNPPHWMDAYVVLGKWGLAVVLPFLSNTMDNLMVRLPRPAYYGGRKLTPLEEVAADTLQHLFGGTGAHYVDNLIKFCGEFRIDAIVNAVTRGATCVDGFKRIIEERAEKELGIPTLHLEYEKSDPEFITEVEMTAKLDEFARMCLASKGLA